MGSQAFFVATPEPVLGGDMLYAAGGQGQGNGEVVLCSSIQLVGPVLGPVMKVLGKNIFPEMLEPDKTGTLKHSLVK